MNNQLTLIQLNIVFARLASCRNSYSTLGQKMLEQIQAIFDRFSFHADVFCADNYFVHEY